MNTGTWDLHVKVLKIGSCTIDPLSAFSSFKINLNYQMGIGGGSTVTLIKDEKNLLLIDTGYEKETDFSQTNDENNWKLLNSLLQLHRIRPSDITKLFITHFHRNHFGNIEYFSNAKWYCYQSAHAALKLSMKDKFIPLNEGDQIAAHTTLLHTPGHTPGHSSLICVNENKSVRVAICGDAIINLSWLQAGQVWKYNSDFYDLDAAKLSITRLLSEADIIIP